MGISVLPTEIAELPKPLAFVLSGGSAAGAVQVGMLKALSECGITPDLVVATSVGAINGAAVAALGNAASDHLAKVWMGLDRSDILGSLSLRTVITAIKSRDHLFDQDALLELFADHLPTSTFEELPIRLGVVATNAQTGQAETLTTGSLETALLASSAIPGFFPQVEIEDQRFFDGGVTANVPIRQAINLGAKSVIVLDAAQLPWTKPTPTNFVGSIQHVVSLMTRTQRAAAVGASEDVTVIKLPLVTPAGHSCFDFSQTEELIDVAYESTLNFLTSGDHSQPLAHELTHELNSEDEWPQVAEAALGA